MDESFFSFRGVCCTLFLIEVPSSNIIDPDQTSRSAASDLGQLPLMLGETQRDLSFYISFPIFIANCSSHVLGDLRSVRLKPICSLTEASQSREILIIAS